MANRTPQRRVTDHLRALFHEACDTGNLAASESLLNSLVRRVVRPKELPVGVDRRRPDDLTGPCERLANLQLHQPHRTWPDGDNKA